MPRIAYYRRRTDPIDDFGTGYSAAWSYLQKLDVDTLKIAKFRSIPSSTAAGRRIIEMAKALNLATVAEGVEPKPARLAAPARRSVRPGGFTAKRCQKSSSFCGQSITSMRIKAGGLSGTSGATSDRI
ncbi:EAL domain-containing protein [Klebsiella pneumoniae]|nr:EAL domain-containing protein [Klebsiella pneumoniae]